MEKTKYDINYELEELIIKYNINKYSPEIDNCIKAKKLILELFKSIPDSKIIAIRGGGEHTEQILSLLSDNEKRKIKYIVDKTALKGKFLTPSQYLSIYYINIHADFFTCNL